MGKEKRTDEYRKDKKEENKLLYLNNILADTEKELISEFGTPEKPITFIVGAPRSATTLTHQLLAKTGYYTYVSNFVARFWKAPYLGLLQEQALGIKEKNNLSYQSDYGRTDGWSGPHQFNYFWQKWLQFDEDHKISAKNLAQMDLAYFKKELGAMESVYSNPILFKSLYCGKVIKFLKKTLKRAKFVICLRNPLYQAQSNLLGREAFFGNKNDWFSLKPDEYTELKEINAYEQVAGQIFYILKNIERDIQALNKQDYVVIPYGDFMDQPREKVLEMLNLAYGKDHGLDVNKTISKEFENRNRRKLEDRDWKKLKDAVEIYFGKNREYIPFSEYRYF